MQILVKLKNKLVTVKEYYEYYFYANDPSNDGLFITEDMFDDLEWVELSKDNLAKRMENYKVLYKDSSCEDGLDIAYLHNPADNTFAAYSIVNLKNKGKKSIYNWADIPEHMIKTSVLKNGYHNKCM